MSTRITERETLRALADACEALGLPCAYTLDGERKDYDEIRAMVWVDDVSAAGGRYGAITLDHQPQYGGARVHAYPGDGGTGHCRAPGMFTANGIPSGMDERMPLRKVHDALREIARNAWGAQREEFGTTTREDLKAEVVALRSTLGDIHALLDGREWCADTTQSIAEVLTGAGYTIREPLDA